jgi:1-deoxy-D-xylulose-5-phosphate synthase
MVGPVLIHIVTQKGKGYAPAEKDAALFHGTGPFELKTGKQLSSGNNLGAILGLNSGKFGKKNPKIVAITAAMIAGTGLTKFEENFPDRFFV